MAYKIITQEFNHVLYTIAYRYLPIFEMGVNVPNYSYYIQTIESKQHDIFDTSVKPPRKITVGDVMELGEDKISAVLQTIMLINQMENEIKHNPSETF
uniref:Uncharacterized protein n=1 Tax=viral metagenome TaxID=1070528 RepID=A0A6C0B9S0_9ZZZZ